MTLLYRAAALLLLPLALTACDGEGLAGFGFPGLGAEKVEEVPAGPPAAPQPPAISPLEVPIEITGDHVAVGTAHAATYQVQQFTARGNEPFWSVTIDGNRAVLKRAGMRDATIPVQPINFAKGVEYSGTLGGRPFSLNIRAEPCEDSMSGASWPMTAVLGHSGKQHPGCAAPAGQEPKGEPQDAPAPVQASETPAS